MDGTSQPSSVYVSLWEADQQAANSSRSWPGWVDAVLQWCRAAGRASVLVNRRAVLEIVRLSRHVATASPRALAVVQAVRSTILARSEKLIPLLFRAAPQIPEEQDTVRALLSDFNDLGRSQQDRVARNLVLLWDNFQSLFGGISGFLAAPATEQTAFMERLKTASERMEAARGSDASFHYVTVELMRQYIAFLQAGRADEQALALATCVVSLIDRGHQMAAEPIAYSVKS